MVFNSMWERKNENKPLEVPKLPQYIYDETTYRPGAKDENGKFINETRFDLVVKGQKTKLQDYIQSFEEDTDVYKILERCARSGDYSLLLSERDDYGDTTMFKADRADNDVTLKALQESNSQTPKELAEAILGNLSNDEILAIVQNLQNKNNATVDSTAAASEEVANNA